MIYSEKFKTHLFFMAWLEEKEAYNDEYDEWLISDRFHPRGVIRSDYELQIVKQFIEIKRKRDRLKQLLKHYDCRKSVETKLLADLLLDREEKTNNELDPEIVIVPWVPVRDENRKLIF